MSNFILSLSSLFIYFIMRMLKSFHMLQQNLYNDGHRYLKWMCKNLKKIFIEWDFIILLAFIIMFFNLKIGIFIYFVTYFLIIYLVYRKQKHENVKIPLKITDRIKRLIVTSILLFILLIIFILSIYNENNIIVYYAVISGFVYLTYVITYVASLINHPIERLVYYKFRRQAINKLTSMKHLEVIGITGSYGKTSSKNILSDILNIKYNALPTPRNLNTPYGLIITINNHLDKFDDFLIAEMGAYKRGEIRELCDLVHPKYGILTKIGTAHLESFGSQSNIQKGKFELIESLPQDGIGILNMDDDLQVSYPLKNKCKIIWIGIDNENADVRALNIKGTNKGMRFDVKFKNQTELFHFETKLLGQANVYNILAAIALGYELKIDPLSLNKAVMQVNTIPHRLELKKSGSLNIIDDAYNSNPVGSKMALEVLNLMPGKKIIATPGMTELGDKQYELNKQFGSYIADVCDEVILVGKSQTKPIYDGLVEKGYDECHIYVVNNLPAVFDLTNKLMDQETYLLLENDLPDIFNE